MFQYTKRDALVRFRLASACLSSFLLLVSHASAQQSFNAEVNSIILQLNSEDVNLRRDAIWHLAAFGRNAESVAVPALINALKDKRTSRYAAYALGSIGSKAKLAVPALIEALKDNDEMVRAEATWALGTIGTAPKSAVPALIRELKDSNAIVRTYAVYALGQLGSESKTAIPALIEALRDKRSTLVRFSAAGALGKIGPESRAAVPVLIGILKESKRDSVLRAAAGSALGYIGPAARSAIPALVEALEDEDKQVRSNAAFALGSIRPDADVAVPPLIKSLKDEEWEVRANAAHSLAKMSPVPPEIGQGLQEHAVDVLIDTLKDENESVSGAAANTLARVAEGLQSNSHSISLSELDAEKGTLIKILAAVKAYTPAREGDIEAINRSLYALHSERQSRIVERAIARMSQNKVLVVTALYLVLLPLLWSIFLWLRPLWLLRINDTLNQHTSLTLPDWLGGIKVSASTLILSGFFHYLPRVLDAWVNKQASEVRKRFGRRNTVGDRKIHVAAPVVMDGKLLAALSGKDLKHLFTQNKACLLICGEGGSGKTSLACQAGKWALSEDKAERLCDHKMLPVLIEEELNSKLPQERRFTDTVRWQLQDLTAEAEPPSEELVNKLLQHRRILVIVDGLSEMSDATKSDVRPDSPHFFPNALIVTSRNENVLGIEIDRTLLRPLRVQGNRLSSFMEAYLVQRGKREQFTDKEFFDACGRLSTIMRDRDITVLLAKLYAEQMIASKEGFTEGTLPDNIPDLMLSYLNDLNRGSVESKEPDDRAVQRDAKIIAWECLKETYRPTPAKRIAVVAALTGDDVEARLKYLEDRLRLIQTVGPGKDQISFSLDPMAEYLAGLHILDTYKEDEQLWRKFLMGMDSMPGAPEAIKGFLLAVRDCCLAKGKAAKVPDFVLKEIL